MVISKRKMVVAAIMLALGVLAAGVFLYMWMQKDGLEYENATVGLMPGDDLDARLALLQQQVDEGQIAFAVNTSPLFQTGRSKGNLMLENPANNGKLLVAQLVLNSSGQVVYESKAVKPGSYLETITLDKPLPKGEYPATIYLKAYRESDQELLGQTGAALTLTVLA